MKRTNEEWKQLIFEWVKIRGEKKLSPKEAAKAVGASDCTIYQKIRELNLDIPMIHKKSKRHKKSTLIQIPVAPNNLELAQKLFKISNELNLIAMELL